jgi:cysteine desulfurase
MIYLDYNASTPCDPRVVEAMLPYFYEKFGNPSQAHGFGRVAAISVRRAREYVAKLINTDPQKLIFTSGATESNNIAIMGVVLSNIHKRCKIVTTKIEHSSVLEPCKRTSIYGCKICYLPVDNTGRVDLDAAADIITDDTALVSVQAANNEIGTVQDIKALAAIAHERGALFHCDAAQAVGKTAVDVQELDVDLLSISGHKLYGPKGIGVLYIQGEPNHFPLTPLMIGGGQENGLRPGTLNVPGIVGIGEACRIMDSCWQEEAQRIAGLRDYFEDKIRERFPTVRFNGNRKYRLPGTTSITFPGIDTEALLANTPDLAWSVGSACNSGALEPSHVLLGIGVDRISAYQTIRVGIGRFTTQNELGIAAELISSAIHRI